MERRQQILITLSAICVCAVMSSCALVVSSPSKLHQDATAKHYRFTHGKQPHSQADWLKLVKEFQQVVELNPQSDVADDAQYAIGSCYLWLSEKSPSQQTSTKTKFSHSQKAIAAFQKVVTNYPNSVLVADAQYWSGYCYLRLGDVENAVMQFQRVVEEHREAKIYEYALLGLSECYEKLGDYHAAIAIHAKIVTDSKHQHLVEFSNSKLSGLWTMAQPKEKPEPTEITQLPPHKPSTQKPETPERTVVIKRIPPQTHVSNPPKSEPTPSEIKPTRIKPLNPSSLSLVQQLGLGVRTIVIDPGHGGKNPGAVGRRRVVEKNVVLNIAKELKALLQERNYQVYLTREEDVHIGLKARTRFANEKSADLFISIHANAHHSASATGVETYYLSLASDESARLTATRENVDAGMSIKDLENLVSDILKDSKVTESSKLAEYIQKNLVEETGAANRGVKRAPFVVLIGAKVPAILVEVGFMSNPKEERLLSSAAYQILIANALLKAIEEYANCSLSNY